MKFAERMKGVRGTRYTIPRPRDGYHSDDRDMAVWLGRKGDSWPDAGVAPRELCAVGRYRESPSHGTHTWNVPIKVWVDPKVNKPTFLRVKCECPGCHRVLPVGRLAQHVCKAGIK